MIYRQLIEELQKWSERDTRKPLVLRGARQVGKTTLVNEFGKRYDVYIKLNLERSSDAEVFSKSDNVKEIFQFICLRKKIKVDESKRTLLFIDEIQNEPKAVGLLRYFYERCHGCTSLQQALDFKPSSSNASHSLWVEWIIYPSVHAPSWNTSMRWAKNNWNKW